MKVVEVIGSAYLLDAIDRYKREAQDIFQTFDVFIDKLNRLEFNDYRELNIAVGIVKLEWTKINAIVAFLNEYCKEPWVKGLMMRYETCEESLKEFKICI